MIKIICPKCSEEIVIDRNRPNAFCSYCGEKIENNRGIYSMHCPTCNEVVDADLSCSSGFCNYCGNRIDYNHSHESVSREVMINEKSKTIEKSSANIDKKHSPLGIVAFILALTGLLAPIAIILSIVDLATSKKNGTKKHSLAVAGLIIGSILTFLGLVVGPLGCAACGGFVDGFVSGIDSYVPDDTIIDRNHIKLTIPGEFGYMGTPEYDFELGATLEINEFNPDSEHFLMIVIIDSYYDPTEKYGGLNNFYHEWNDVMIGDSIIGNSNGTSVKYISGKEGMECTGIAEIDGDRFTYTITYVYDTSNNTGLMVGLFEHLNIEKTYIDEYREILNSVKIK